MLFGENQFWNKLSVFIIFTRSSGAQQKQQLLWLLLLRANQSMIHTCLWQTYYSYSHSKIVTTAQFWIFCLPAPSKNVNIKIYKTTILPTVLYGYGTLGLSYEGRNIDWGCLKTGCREENLDLTREQVTGSSRKLHNEELHSFYNSQNIIRMICSMHWRNKKYI